MTSHRLKCSERMEIISEFITTGNCRKGFSVIEDKNGRYRVKRLTQCEHNGELTASEIQERIQELQQQLASLTNVVAPKTEDESANDALPTE